MNNGELHTFLGFLRCWFYCDYTRQSPPCELWDIAFKLGMGTLTLDMTLPKKLQKDFSSQNFLESPKKTFDLFWNAKITEDLRTFNPKKSS